MEDQDRTKEQLIDELGVAALEATVAEHQRVREALCRRQDELAARNAILSATLRTTDLDELLGLVLDEVLSFLGAEFASIHLVQADELVLRAWRGPSAAFRAHILSFPADDPPDWLREFRVVHEHLNDTLVTPEFAKGEGIQAWTSVPLCLPPKDGGEERWVGTLMVGSQRYEALGEDDVAALQAIAGQLALAIDHVRIYRESQERLARLQTLHEIDRGIIQRLELRDLLRVVLERVPKELGADATAISLLDEEQLCTQVFVMHLPNGTFIKEEAFELADSLLHWFVERQEPVIIYDLAQDPRVQVHRRRIRTGRLVSYLGVPLVVRDKTIGILHIMTTQPRVFADEDVAFFRTMAGQAAIAIENARLYEAVKQELAMRIEVEQALRESEERYRSLFDGVPVGLYRTTPDGRFLDANRALVEMLGYPDCESLLATNAVDLYVDPADRERGLALTERKGVLHGFQARLRRYNGTTIWARDTSRAVRDAAGNTLYYEGCLEDITERVRMEETLRRSKREWETTFHAMSDWVSLVDLEARILRSNRAAKEFVRTPLADMIGQTCCKLLHGSEKPIPGCPLQKMLHTRQRENLEIQTSDGSGWLMITADPVTDDHGNLTGAVHIVRDITWRKQVEEELHQSREQLRRLADYLQTAREKERARIARELHDEFAQALTALKMDLAWLAKKLPDEPPALREKARSMAELIDRTVEATRRVIAELRPGLLDSLGLATAIEWQAEEFAQRTGIEVELHGTDQDIALHPDLATALFRIFQEALTNVARHAQATRVVVRLEASLDEVVLMVRDNGKGITESQVADPESLGLMGMRERAAAWGGTITFEGVPGQGTTVTVRVPRAGGRWLVPSL